MGLELYNTSQAAREVFQEADDSLGIKLSKLIFRGPDSKLKNTANSQPAIMTVSIAAWKAWKEQAGEDEVPPSMVAGHSLGEYSALAIGEAFDFGTGLNLVKVRAENMAQAGRLQEGSMAAIIGLDDDRVTDLCNDYSGEDIVVAANFNSPGQVVISGTPEAVTTVMTTAKSNGGRYSKYKS